MGVKVEARMQSPHLWDGQHRFLVKLETLQSKESYSTRPKERGKEIRTNYSYELLYWASLLPLSTTYSASLLPLYLSTPTTLYIYLLPLLYSLYLSTPTTLLIYSHYSTHIYLLPLLYSELIYSHYSTHLCTPTTLLISIHSRRRSYFKIFGIP